MPPKNQPNLLRQYAAFKSDCQGFAEVSLSDFRLLSEAHTRTKSIAGAAAAANTRAGVVAISGGISPNSVPLLADEHALVQRLAAAGCGFAICRLFHLSEATLDAARQDSARIATAAALGPTIIAGPSMGPAPILGAGLVDVLVPFRTRPEEVNSTELDAMLARLLRGCKDAGWRRGSYQRFCEYLDSAMTLAELRAEDAEASAQVSGDWVMVSGEAAAGSIGGTGTDAGTPALLERDEFADMYRAAGPAFRSRVQQRILEAGEKNAR